jgi:hypothetical protein
VCVCVCVCVCVSIVVASGSLSPTAPLLLTVAAFPTFRLKSANGDPSVNFADLPELDAEICFLWRVACELATEDQNEDLLERLLCDCPVFCELLTTYQEDEFIMQQLLYILRHIDTSDEASR